MAVAALAALAVLIATRNDPVLSPDSITYLSTAEHLRSLDGYVDFTGEQLSHFPPVFPVLLMPGGRSLVWASIVGAAGAAGAAALFAGLLSARVRWTVAIGGSIAFVLSQAFVRIESTVWSETPYAVLALAMLALVSRPELTVQRAAMAGAVAGLGFLTRYAGAGLVATGLVVVVAATWSSGRRRVIRASVAYLAPVALLGSAWITRNLVATSRPLGPHFEGGADEPITGLAEQVARALGRLVTDIDSVGRLTNPIGYAVLVGLLVATVLAFVRRPVNLIDVGMAAFALTSIIVPTVSRAFTGTHIEARIMSPTLIPVIYFVVVAVDRLARNRLLAVAAVAGAVVWSYQGAIASLTFPDRLGGSADNVRQFAPALYDVIADLPDDANVLTNSPQRVWWQTGRFPTSFAFTVPEPGNSHFPLSPHEMVQKACAGDTYLAWFSGLANTRRSTPDELRPDLAELVELTPIETVPGGQLYQVTATDPTACG